MLAPKPALADSDGYYCVGPDYLAYQFGVAAPPVAPQHLYIIRLNHNAMMTDTMMIELPQFQVQGMICDAGTVRIAAYDGLITVQLDTSRRPVGYTREDWVAGNVPLELARIQGSLGGTGYSGDYRQWGKTIRRPLQKSSNPEFVLEFVPDAVKPNQCRTQITTTLLELDSKGKTIRSRRLFRGPAYRACGGGGE